MDGLNGIGFHVLDFGWHVTNSGWIEVDFLRGICVTYVSDTTIMTTFRS